MKELNEIIEVNLKLLSDADRNSLLIHDFEDVNGNSLYASFNLEQFALEMEKRDLVSIIKETCIITELGLEIVNNGGWIKYQELEKNRKELLIEKENIEFEKSKIDLKLNKWLLKTKWIPHIISLISIIFAVYVYLDSKEETTKLEKRIEKLELRLLETKNESKK